MGAGAPKRKTVVIDGSSPPAFETIFSKNDADALNTLDAWKSNIKDSFNQIQGKKSAYLSSDEIETLVRYGFVKLDDNTERSVARAKCILTLLGFRNGISADNVDALFDWLKTNRPQLRDFYQAFLADKPKLELLFDQDGINSQDLIALLRAFGSLFELGGNEALTPTEMADLLRPWVPDEYPHAKNSIESGLSLTIGVISSLCGDRVDSTHWNGKKIGTCFAELTEHFKPTAPVFDFLFGRLNPFTQKNELNEANARLIRDIKSWLDGHHHPAFQTVLVSDFSKKLDIPPPYNFFKLAEWLPTLNKASTPAKLDPTLFIDLGGIISNWALNFQTATAKENCSLYNWRKCDFKGDYDAADQLYSDEYATLIRSKNLDYIYKISLYDAAAKFLLSKLDSEREGHQVQALVTLVIRLLDSNAYIYNVVNRALEKPVDPSSIEDSTKNIRREGLAELAAFAADIVPERGKDHQGMIRRLARTAVGEGETIPYTVDRLGIIAFLSIYDLITNLREDYLKKYDLPVQVEGPNDYVKRKMIMEALPKMLNDHFPDIYQQCVAWGFERTCGVAYTVLLDSPDKGRDDLQTYEIDFLSLASILIESMMNRCDQNGDGVLESQLKFGFDEKSCMINLARNLVIRLMNANIVKPDPKTKRLMDWVQKIGPVRWAGKVALRKGTIRGLGIQYLPPFSLVSRGATIGSVLSLAAELMDSDKVKAIEAGVEGPPGDPGDELIYLGRLTERYLPTPPISEVYYLEDED